MQDRSTGLTFELSRRAITAAEQRTLAADTASQGLDDRYWLATGSRSDTPLVLCRLE